MLLLRLLVVVVSLLGVAFVVLQVLIPLFTRTALFPMFRRKRTEVLSEILETKALLEDEALKDTLEALQEQLKAKQAEDVPEVKPEEKV